VVDCPRVVGEGIHVLHDTWVQAFEGGQDFLPDPDAQKARVAVRGVEAVRYAMPANVGVDVASPGLEHRADAVPVAGREHGEAASGRAAEDTNEERLGPVIRVVPRRDPRGACGARGGLEGVPPRRPRPRLEVAAGVDVDARASERNVELLGERGGSVELQGCFGSQAVVNPMGKQAKAQLAAQSGEHMEQGHRVGAPADSDQHRRAAREELVAA